MRTQSSQSRCRSPSTSEQNCLSPSARCATPDRLRRSLARGHSNRRTCVPECCREGRLPGPGGGVRRRPPSPPAAPGRWSPHSWPAIDRAPRVQAADDHAAPSPRRAAAPASVDACRKSCPTPPRSRSMPREPHHRRAAFALVDHFSRSLLLAEGAASRVSGEIRSRRRIHPGFVSSRLARRPRTYRLSPPPAPPSSPCSPSSSLSLADRSRREQIR